MPARKHGRSRCGKAVPEKRQSWKVDEFNVQIACGLTNRMDSKEDIFARTITNPRKAARSVADRGDGKRDIDVRRKGTVVRRMENNL